MSQHVREIDWPQHLLDLGAQALLLISGSVALENGLIMVCFGLV